MVVEYFKRKRMERYIDNFINNFCKNYPFYMNKLNNNIELSKALIRLYESFKLPDRYGYKGLFRLSDSIDIASSILGSISSDLKDRYLDEIKKGTIVFEETNYSYLDYEDSNVKIVIDENKSITVALASVHEFFHLLHLEKVNYEFESSNYYCYTEALGMAGEIYAILYLLKNRTDLKEDVLAYLFEFAKAINDKANKTLIDGMLISMYATNKSLSKDSIKRFIKAYEESADYLNIFNYKKYAVLDYVEDVRYIYSLPQALIIASRLFYDNNFRNNYSEIISELSEISYPDWANKYINDYIKEEGKMVDLLSEMQLRIKDLYNDEKGKVKKLR